MGVQQGSVSRIWVRVGGRAVAVHVLELGLACCGIEVRAARRAAQAVGTAVDAIPEGTAAADLHVLVVAGTVTRRLADDVVAAHAALPHPRAVLAFGACAATGGPYWDSYSVLPGAHELVEVDVWVPGCPPRPADLLAGLAEVLDARA